MSGYIGCCIVVPMTLRAGITKTVIVVVAGLMALGIPVVARAHVESVDVPLGRHYSSSNLRWVKHVPMGSYLSKGTNSVFVEGAQRVGHYLYLADNGQGLLIFDIRDPLNPVRVGEFTLLADGVVTAAHVQENERVATNGKILLLSQLGDGQYADDPARASKLHVIDVNDKKNPRLIRSINGIGDHTWTCLLDCTWAYSGSGIVLDLRTPTAPRVSEVNWFREAYRQSGLTDPLRPEFGSHYVTEVAPGRMLAASGPMLFVDATKPEAPKLLATSALGDFSAHHNVDWPRNGNDDFIIGVNEPGNPGFPRCEMRDAIDPHAVVSTWDASNWRQTGEFQHIDDYAVHNGTYSDGNPAVGVGLTANMGCGAHFFGIHPAFKNGGLIAEASYAHGLKLLDVDSTGHMTEVGYFLADGANAADAIWITPEVVYVLDYQRGIDIVRYVPDGNR